MMKDVIPELCALLRKDGLFICIAGDVRLHGGKRPDSIFNTAEAVAELAIDKGFIIERRMQHEVVSRRRYFHALSSSNGHSKGNVLERVFIARKAF